MEKLSECVVEMEDEEVVDVAQEYLDATIRFSMSEFTTLEEIDYTLDALYNIVPMLRRYTRH